MTGQEMDQVTEGIAAGIKGLNAKDRLTVLRKLAELGSDEGVAGWPAELQQQYAETEASLIERIAREGAESA